MGIPAQYWFWWLLPLSLHCFLGCGVGLLNNGNEDVDHCVARNTDEGIHVHPHQDGVNETCLGNGDVSIIEGVSINGGEKGSKRMIESIELVTRKR